MTEEQQNNNEHFLRFCEGMEFSGMMEAMISQREEVCGCGCMDMMKKMMPKSFSPRKQEKETPG